RSQRCRSLHPCRARNGTSRHHGMTMTRVSVFNVREHGALGDGQTLDSPAIQSAIDACSALGGGTVYLPAGQYLTGSLFLRNNISLHLDSGAVILGSEN